MPLPITDRTLVCGVCAGFLVVYFILFQFPNSSVFLWLWGKPSITSDYESLIFQTLDAQCNTTIREPIKGAFTNRCLPEDLSYMPYEAPNPNQTTKLIGKPKLIVNLNRQEWWFPEDKHYQNLFNECEYNACRFTDDQTLLPQADAVFVTVCRLNAETPPRRYSHKQLWIAFAMESPEHYDGFHDSPNWKSVFNLTMGYMTDSDIFTPYGYLGFRSKASLKNYTSIAVKKTRTVAWFVSHCQTPSKRQRYVKDLQKYIDVDIYGACSQEKCPKQNETECLRLLNTTYYFYLSFENSFCQDYVTGKFFKLFDNVDVVPIVRGAANYSRYFPHGTFINTADFTSPQNLANYLKTLIADPLLYARMLEAKDQVVNVATMRLGLACRLCKHLHLSESQHKVYPDFMKWTHERGCYKPNDAEVGIKGT